MPTSVVVTGGAGFIGSHLVDALVEAGHRVRVLDDVSTGYRENVNKDAELIEGDVADAEVVRDTMKGAEVVFHQAAHRAVLRSVHDPLSTDRANTHGTLTVLKAAVDAGVRRVVSASSSSVYGGATQWPTPEETPVLPKSPYAVSKVAGEHYCRVFSELYGIETASLRYFNVYGPRQRPDSAYAAVIPLFIEALHHREPATVHGDGLQSRDFTFISDVVSANLAAMNAPSSVCMGNAYNVAAGFSYSLLELLNALARILQCEAQIIHTEPRAGDVRRTFADISTAQRNLGYEPRVDLNAGLAQTVDWFLH